MPKQTTATEKTATKQQTKPQPTVEPLAGMAEAASEALPLARKKLPATRLGDLRFSAIQRQILANKIGGIQGNIHLQRQLIKDRSGANFHCSPFVGSTPIHDVYPVQEYPNMVQLNGERLADREENARFTQTRTYEAFEAEVRHWLARRVLSRTNQAHRERRLVPNGFLRGYYNMIRPGEPIDVRVHFQSNGYSFRQVTFLIPGEEIVLSIGQNETERAHEQPHNPTISPGSDPSIRQIEDLLRRLPVATPKEVDKTKKILSLVLKLRNAGIEGGTGKQFPALPGLILDVDSLIQQLKNGEYADAAITVVSIGGNLASISSWLITAAIEMGVPIGVTSAMAQSGVVLGVIGEIAGPAVIALSTLIEVARIPSGVNENQGKIYYIADVSGILTSWLFNNPSISPHSQLMVEARTGGYFGSDLTKYLRDAHRTAHEIWQSYFSGHPERVTHARKEVAGNYQACWRLLGQQLEPKLKPEPDGIALSFINKLIAGVEELRKERLREERYRRRGLL